MSCEKCERDIERLRGDLNVLRIEMIEVVGGMLARVGGMLARVDDVLANVDEVLATVKTSNRQMFADLQAQTDAGFSRLQACIEAPFRTDRKDDEPPKLN